MTNKSASRKTQTKECQILIKIDGKTIVIHLNKDEEIVSNIAV